MYIVVPLYSHVTKSTPIPPQTPKITLTLFDPHLRTKPNYSLPKLTPQTPQQNTPSPHYLSPTLSNYPTLYKPLINPIQINKISPKIPHLHSTSTSNLIPSTSKHNLNKNLLKFRIIPHTPKISTLI